MSTITLALIGNTLLAAATCLIAEIVRRAHRPALAHAIWTLALLKLITPPLWQVHFAAPAPATPITARVAVPIASTDLPQPTASAATPHLVSVRAATISPPVATPRAPRSLEQILLTAWCAGSLSLLAITLLRLTRFRLALRTTEPANEHFTDEIHDIARQLGLTRTVRACLAAEVCPMIWFVGFRPLMVLPRSILTMDAQQRKAILAHELAHLRRGDHWIRLLELFITIALWWHPLVWLARYRLREAEEEACDAWVLWAMPHAGKTYAQTLVDMVRLLAGSVPAGASGLGGFGQLQRRLIMILEKSPRKSIGLAGWIMVAILAVSLPLAVARAKGSDKSPTTQPRATTAPSDATTTAMRGLLEACADKDPNLRQAASQSIFAFGDKAIPILVDGMRDPATSDTAKALLSNFGQKAADPLIAELDSKDRAQRLNALQALQSLIPNNNSLFGGIGVAQGERPGFAAPAPGGIASDPQYEAYLPRIESAVAKLTRDPEAEIRQRVATMLGILSPWAKDETAIDRLMTMLDDEDKQVRQLAAQSLAMHGPKATKAVEALTKLTTDSDPAVRTCAINALGAIGPGAKTATAAVAKALKDSDPQVRLSAASALGRMNATE